MSLVGSKRVAPPPRKPSPPRGNVGAEEQTFKQKLDEIKRLRTQGETKPAVDVAARLQAGEEPVIPKQVNTLKGVKTFLKSFADWMEVVSKSGKVYYYNKKTLVNQWHKPEEWEAEELRLNPPLPPPPPLPPAASLPPPPEEPEATGGGPPRIKMKLKTKKKVTGKRGAAGGVGKNSESRLPLAYQKNAPKLMSDSDDSDEDDKSKVKLTMENAFDSATGGGGGGGDEAGNGELKLAKLDAKDEIGHLKLPKVEDEPAVDGGSAAANPPPPSGVPPPPPGTVLGAVGRDPKSYRKFDHSVSGPERANMLAQGSAAALAFQNLRSVPEERVMFGDSLTTGGLAVSGEGSGSTLGNPTFFTEYNLPCCLRRCKFPKEHDVLHELKINKMKKRNFRPPLFTGLDPKLAHLAEEAELEQFFIELKDYNNHDRLLTSRMGEVLVYKVADDVWDRYFHKFQIKIFDGVYLECKPSGYSHSDELIYSRTGKVCGRKTFPEDEARCQAVLQAWKKDYCLCVYANKVFTVKRNDRQWEDDLYEVRKFLQRNGY